ncbi:YfbR-like 5'-deoxynucleotidase [Hominenteromicrobium sp.]|uniref:YfbR-like 5'-deoxynucleotidase n=1 Tax=Hominenteromicrobium sp. TaxID=3073581 RepID=UPI003AEFEC40
MAHALAVIGNKRLGKEYNAERAALLGLYHDTPEIKTEIACVKPIINNYDCRYDTRVCKTPYRCGNKNRNSR